MASIGGAIKESVLGGRFGVFRTWELACCQRPRPWTALLAAIFWLSCAAGRADEDNPWSITNVAPYNHANFSLPEGHGVFLWQDFETPFNGSNAPAGGYPASGWNSRSVSNAPGGDPVPWQWLTTGFRGNPTSANLSHFDGARKRQPSRRPSWTHPTLGTSNRFAYFTTNCFGAVTRLITPPVDLSPLYPGETATLAFWHTQVIWPPNQDKLMLYITPDADNVTYMMTSAVENIALPRVEGEAARGWTCLAAYHDVQNAWTQRVFALTNDFLVGATNVALIFEAVGGYGQGLSLDDLIIYGRTSPPPGSTWVQVTNLWQDFETPWTSSNTPAGGFPSTGWSKAFISNSVDWVQATNGLSGSPPSARTNAWVNPATDTSNQFARFNVTSYGSITRLFTPPMNMEGMTGAVVRFWHAQWPWAADQDELRVRMTTNFDWAAATNASAPGWTTLAHFASAQTSWVERVLSIPEPLSTNVVIAFEGLGEYAYGVCVDDLKITAWSNTVRPPRFRIVTNLWQDFETPWTAGPTNEWPPPGISTNSVPQGGFPDTGWSKAIITGEVNWVQATQGMRGYPTNAWTSHESCRRDRPIITRVGEDAPWVNPVTGTSNNFAWFGMAAYSRVTRLFTPPLDLSQSHSVTMSFWHVRLPWPPEEDRLRVMVTTNFSTSIATNGSGVGWHELAYYGWNSQICTWSNIVLRVPRSQYGTNTVFAFEAINDYSYGICIDDMKIVSMEIEEEPEETDGGIALNPSSLAFSGTFGGANPAGQAFDVGNVGESAFTWTATGLAAWLSASPSNGAVAVEGNQPVMVSVDLAGLSAGEHVAQLELASANATNSPQSLSVTVTVARATQTITFPAIAPQPETARTPLDAAADSGLPVTFGVESGPGVVEVE
jgi:hypothetical protein